MPRGIPGSGPTAGRNKPKAGGRPRKAPAPSTPPPEPTPIHSAEDRRHRFVRLAEIRTSKALEAMAQLGQLANHDRYQYGEADVEAIALALNGAVDRTTKALQAGKAPRAHFTLETAEETTETPEAATA